MYDEGMMDAAPAPDAEHTLEAQRRQQLMRATMECVAELGVEKTTMWMVAQRAGVSTGMLLYYYRNKRDLISSAVKQAAQDFSQRLFSATHGEWGLERLRKSIEIILSESDAVPRNFLIQYRMAALNDADIRRSSLEQFRASREALSNSIAAAKSRGELRPDVNVSLLADLVYALANGLAAEVAAHPELMTPERASSIGQLALDAFCSDGATVALASEIESSENSALGMYSAEGDTYEVVRGLLLSDPRLSKRTAEELASAFQQLYQISVRESAGGSPAEA